MNFRKRQQSLRQSLPAHRLDALLVTHLANVRYLCGFTGSSAALLILESGSVFFSDGRYSAQARQEVDGARIVIAAKSPLASAVEWLKQHRASLTRTRSAQVGIEAENLSVAEHAQLARAIGSGFRLSATSSLVESLRMIKDADEIRRLRAASRLGNTLFDSFPRWLRPGRKEVEAAADLEHAALSAGAEGMSFPTIIASGRRSALPHGRASSARIRSGQFVVCDFGVILAGYCSDMTRTVCVGRPSNYARTVYQAVLEAQQAGLAAVKPGGTTGEVDDAARKMLQKNKLARFFTHSTGHGVGLEIHEAPRVAAGQTEALVPGMVITIEPGVYLPGKFGVRIEDLVVVTERGYEVLSLSSKELIAL